jgi:hypothetical protein
VFDCLEVLGPGGRGVRRRALREHLSVWACVIAVAGAVAPFAEGQALPSTSRSLLSHSGQFVIQASPAAQPAAGSHLAADPSLVRLEPALVSVSCERIKQSLLRDLGAPSTWKGKIYLELVPVRAPGQMITLTSEHFKNGWQYRVELPDLVERDRYVRALVQVLLLELANRRSSERLSEIPLWLTEGLSERLLTSKEMDLIVPPPRDTINGLSVTATRLTQRREDPVERARAQLGNRLPLSFDRLGWQSDSQVSGPGADLYRASAQLFVGELLRLPNGRANLAAMVARLSQYYNWQLAFLDAFSASFQRPLDVEKWWALCSIQSPVREPAKDRAAEASWDDLEHALCSPSPAPTQNSADSPPPPVTLQTVIRTWDRVLQTHTLTSKLPVLNQLRLRLPPDLAVLAQEYLKAIEVYLQNQRWSKPVLFTGGGSGSSRTAAETLERLDALDVRREALRPAKTPSAASEPTPPPGPPH